MISSRQRLLLLFASIPVLVLICALVYQAGMGGLEGAPRSFWESVGWAGETLTTTGYGGDSHWSHPLMVVFVVAVQFVGVFLVFLVFPIYLIPFLEERFETRLPRKAPELEGHVIVFRYGPAVETLIDEATEAGLEVLIVEQDEATARRLFERSLPVLYGEAGADQLMAAGLLRARALLANGTDDENAAVVLTARQLGFEQEILVLVEEPYHRRPMTLAGATAVFTPRHILGAALAARASTRISPRVAGIQKLGRRLEVREVRLEAGSPLLGRSLGETNLGARTGATVIGQWVGGRLEAPPTADMRLRNNGILVVVGSEESITRVADLCGGATPLPQEGPFVVGGFGEVGRKVVQLLEDAGEEVLVIDRAPGERVDLVGDMLDLRLLETAGVQKARAVILALDTDTATLFATVILKDLAPRLSVIARVNKAQNVERIHRAGADFALSISQVSGQILARRLLGEESVSVDPQLKVVKASAAGLAGRHPSELQIRERTRASVVAVERGEEVLVEFGPEFRFSPADTLYICGSNTAVRRFHEEFGEERRTA